MSLDFDQALEKALRWLRSSDRFSWEIEAKLVQAGAEPRVVEAVNQRLTELQLVRDDDLAHRLIEKEGQAKGRGPLAAIERLVHRGMEPGRAQVLVESVWGDTDTLAQATSLLENHALKLDSPAKAARFLTRRGFTEEVIASAIDAAFNL